MTPEEFHTCAECGSFPFTPCRMPDGRRRSTPHVLRRTPYLIYCAGEILRRAGWPSWRSLPALADTAPEYLAMVAECLAAENTDDRRAMRAVGGDAGSWRISTSHRVFVLARAIVAAEGVAR